MEDSFLIFLTLGLIKQSNTGCPRSYPRLSIRRFIFCFHWPPFFFLQQACFLLFVSSLFFFLSFSFSHRLNLCHGVQSCGVLQGVAVCCILLQCVTICCSVLQCVAACCSALQCVAVPRYRSVLSLFQVESILNINAVHHRSLRKEKRGTKKNLVSPSQV